MPFAVLALVSLASVVGTALVRRHALAKSLLDVPNARSSHTLPTPRGGGLAIVASFLAGLACLPALDACTRREALVLGIPGLVVALIGFADDRNSLAASARLAAHFVAATVIVVGIGGAPSFPFFGFAMPVSLAWDVVAVIYVVWMLNLFNFMDGIDAIASLEAMTATAGGVALVVLLAPGSATWVLPALLFASVAGFLPWNFPPAKIFMGDAGSGFVGLMLGALPLLAAKEHASFFLAWMILLGVFVVDATTTLLRRAVRRMKLSEAHRSHAYQYASRALGGHRPVALGVAAINVVWLFPWAYAVASRRIDGGLGVLFAYAPLVILAFRYEAGAAERQEKP